MPRTENEIGIRHTKNKKKKEEKFIYTPNRTTAMISILFWIYYLIYYSKKNIFWNMLLTRSIIIELQLIYLTNNKKKKKSILKLNTLLLYICTSFTLRRTLLQYLNFTLKTFRFTKQKFICSTELSVRWIALNCLFINKYYSNIAGSNWGFLYNFCQRRILNWKCVKNKTLNICIWTYI